MKKFTLILLSLTITLTAGWWKTYGGESTDAGYCIQLTDDGGYIISGYNGNNGSTWLVKIDTQGDILWDHTYEERGGYCVQHTADGGYIIACGALLKTDSDGAILWKNYTGLTDESPIWVEETTDGALIAVGYDRVDQSVYDFTVKLSTNGTEVWRKSFYSDAENNFCQEVSEVGYITTGGWDFGFHLDLKRMDNEGNELWRFDGYTWVDGSWTGPGRNVRETFDFGFIVIGSLFSADVSPDGSYLLKTDSAGNPLWGKQYYEYTNDTAGKFTSIQLTSDGGYIITGEIDGDLWLIKTDSVGDTLWTRTYGGEESDIGKSVQQTVDGGYIVVGSTESFGAGGSDIYLIKTDSLGLLAVAEPVTPPETQPGFEVVTAVGREIVLMFNESSSILTLSIYDASGRQVDELHVLQTGGTVSWGTGHSPGVYFIKSSEGRGKAQKVVLVR